MFLSHEKSPSKMKFQKPNILRKRAKVLAKGRVNDAAESASVASPPAAPTAALPGWSVDKVTKHKCSKSAHLIMKPMQRTKQDTLGALETKAKTQIIEDKQDAIYSETPIYSFYPHISNNDDNNDFISIQSSHSGFNFEDLQTFDVEVMSHKDYHDNAESKWCYVSIINDEVEPFPQVNYQYTEDQKNLAKALPEENILETQNNMLVIDDIPKAEPSVKAEPSEPADKPCVLKLLPVNSAVTFMCDVPNCNKEFASKQKLKKHKSTHNKTSPKNMKQVIECPAYKLNPESWLNADKSTCGQQFNARAELVKHLKEEHTLDDAAYRCADCCRPFFWASGVRNHARACLASGRAPRYVCPWPECGRVFQQPCRLKEHVRAHTGDKPYPCRHPNCTWSFRTASKLLRHARRHTGERRHRCGQCGRAFLRGEHLREHEARHAHPCSRRAARRDRQPALQETQPNAADASMLSHQVQNPVEADETSVPVTIEPIISTLSLEESTANKLDSDWSDGEDLFLSPTELRARTAAEGRAARTHCTWPLSPRDHAPPAPPDERVYEVTHVELSEGSESKIYTIRSDLFLHGNMIHNEDSESGVAVIAQTVEEASNGATLQGTPLDAELGLLDAHSTIDLMQEELMYTDAAVDGSSFQLLNDGTDWSIVREKTA